MKKTLLFSGYICILLLVSLPTHAQQTIQSGGLDTNGIITQTGEIILDGFIDEVYDIFVLLNKTGENTLEGKYLYKKVRKFIRLEGKVVGDSIFLDEWNEKGVKTGRFLGNLSNYPSIYGVWQRPNGSGQLDFYLKQIVPIGVTPFNGTWEFAPDSMGIKGKKRPSGPIKEEETIYYHSILYNLNGILTKAFFEEDSQGWWSVHYECKNLKTGQSLHYEDIFREDSKPEVLGLIIAKVKNTCPEQVGPDYSGENIDFMENYVVVTRDGIDFISPCQRSEGYFLGSYTVEFTYEELKPYLKNLV